MTAKGQRILEELTDREKQVLVAAITSGDHLMAVAPKVGLTPQSLKNQMRLIYKKFGVHNRLGLLLLSVQHGIVNCPCGK